MRALALLAVLCLLPAVAHARDNAYLKQLQTRAHALHLSRRRYWHLLLHYQHNILRPGVTSTAVTPWFFNAPNGRTHPRAELDATLAAFFSTHPIGPRKGDAQCVFIARYTWLDSKLHFDRKRMPKHHCPHFRQWMSALNPASAAVIFPTAYVNNPPSMFGHTLLRIDSQGETRATQLLAYAVNYAANTQKNPNGLVFAFKGVFGQYPGRFGLFPYYKKVKQYARIENRDIWAYRLSFTPAQIRRMLRHLWELKDVSFPYLFFTRNCSYQLLTLLETGRPDMHLTRHFHAWVIPTDTLRALKDVPGLVTSVDYRPSRQTVLSTEYSQLPQRAQPLAVKLGDNRIKPGNPAVRHLKPRLRAKTLEVAYDYAAYRLAAGRVKRKQMAPSARRLLLARSRIPLQGPLFAPPQRPRVTPTQGHRTSRLVLGYVNQDSNNSIGFDIRGAYNDLLDPRGGYRAGAEINFGDLAFRYDPFRQKVRFQHLTAVDVKSITPRNALFKPVSWQFQTGVRWAPERPLFNRDHGNLGYYLQGGPGLAYGNLDTVTAYGFALASLDLSPGLRHDARPGAGMAFGLLGHVATGMNLNAEIGGLGFPGARDTHQYWAALGGQWQITQNNGLRLTTRYTDTQKIGYFTTEFSWRWYF